MKTIRQGSFETNSSSTHAIVIPKKVSNEEYSLYDSLDHEYCFGREECRLVEHWDEKLAYVYIILKDYKEWNEYSEATEYPHKRKTNITLENIKLFKERVNKIYQEVYDMVEYKPYDNDPKPNDLFRYIDKEETSGDLVEDSNIHILMDRGGSYVDHVEDFDDNGFLEKILTDDEFLKRFIFNRDSYITVGGDEYRGYNIKTIGFEYDYESEYKHPENDENYELTGEFWRKLEEYEKTHDVYLKGN